MNAEIVVQMVCIVVGWVIGTWVVFCLLQGNGRDPE